MVKSQRGADYPFQFAAIAFVALFHYLIWRGVANVRRLSRRVEQSKRATARAGALSGDESRDLRRFFTLLSFTQKPVCSFAVTTEGKNRQCGPRLSAARYRYAQRPLTASRRFHPCATGKIRKRLRQYQRSRFPFQAHNAEPSGKSCGDRHSLRVQRHLLQLTVTDAVFAIPAYGPTE